MVVNLSNLYEHEFITAVSQKTTAKIQFEMDVNVKLLAFEGLKSILIF